MNVTDTRKEMTPGELEMHALNAAIETGVRLYNLRPSSQHGIAFTLKTGEHATKKHDWRGRLKLMPRYQRLAQHTRTSYAKRTAGMRFSPVVPGAVCWHGHRDFMRALYQRAPRLRIRTAFITYLGAEHFERNYESTWNGRPGGGAAGFANLSKPYQNACTCEE